MVDTGFNGFLTLPLALVGELGLAYIDRRRVILADGREVFMDIYGVSVLGDNRRREIEVAAADGAPLVGMAMLEDRDLSVQVRTGGRMAIAVV